MAFGATAWSVDTYGRSKALMSFEEIPSVLPSKKRGELKLPEVLLPVEVGLKANASSSLPDRPLTEKLPVVER